MPTARNGLVRSQVSIVCWVGARHWSNPKPVKVPGVTGLPSAYDVEGASERTLATRLARASRTARGMRKLRERRRRSSHHNLRSHTRTARMAELRTAVRPLARVVREV